MNYFDFPLEEWTNSFVDNWLLPYLSGFFDQISGILSSFVDGVTNLLIWIPAELIVLVLILLSWKIAGRGMALFTLIGSLFIGSVDLWVESM
ncbi:hypothetical protein J4G37_48585, partial [Microvirga sp. 3-52]|nr:hypothetical protein [Microvirga sp. 3-52]